MLDYINESNCKMDCKANTPETSKFRWKQDRLQKNSFSENPIRNPVLLISFGIFYSSHYRWVMVLAVRLCSCFVYFNNETGPVWYGKKIREIYPVRLVVIHCIFNDRQKIQVS